MPTVQASKADPQLRSQPHKSWTEQMVKSFFSTWPPVNHLVEKIIYFSDRERSIFWESYCYK